MPDLDVAWPYGFHNTEIDEAALRALLGFRQTVMAGTADIDATSPHFPKEPEAMVQGGTRYERAHAYIARARAQAKSRTSTAPGRSWMRPASGMAARRCRRPRHPSCPRHFTRDHMSLYPRRRTRTAYCSTAPR
jgi:hypothetical protein